MNAIEVSQLGFSYGRRKALDGVSFAVAERRMFGLLGPNGGGKTTLFRILATLLPPQRGTARVAGHDVASESRRVRREIGVVFQSNCLDPQLSVRENLVHQGRLYGITGSRLAERIGECLRLFELEERAGDRLSTLSGGLRRRLELARGLLHEPRVLLLDEPTTGLDPGVRHEFWTHLRRLQQALSMTVLFTTHLLEEAERCDLLGILDGGRLVAEGTPDALKAEIGGDVLIVEAADPAGLGERIFERLHVEPVIANGHLRLEHGEGHRLVTRLLESFPGEIQSVKIGKPTLEDVFVARTGHGLRETPDLPQ